MLHYDKQLKIFSQQLRKNTTDAEKYLWSRLRGKQLKGYQFYRQMGIGRYIVDFYCPKAGLAIELAGVIYDSENLPYPLFAKEGDRKIPTEKPEEPK